MITFVAHYEKLNEKDTSKILNICDSFMHWNPIALIELTFASIRKTHPNCRKILITNDTTEIDLSPDIEIMRFPTDKYENRLSQMIATLHFLRAWNELSHIIFHDFDMLFQSNIESIFDGKHDIYFALRGKVLSYQAPINMGLVAIDQSSIPQAIRFYDKIINQMLTFPHLHIWGGSQISVHKLLFHKLLENPKSKETIWDGIRFSFLPQNYNFTSKGYFKDHFYEGKHILHFKGQRKPQMLLYWNKYLKKYLKKLQ